MTVVEMSTRPIINSYGCGSDCPALTQGYDSDNNLKHVPRLDIMFKSLSWGEEERGVVGGGGGGS